MPFWNNPSYKRRPSRRHYIAPDNSPGAGRNIDALLQTQRQPLLPRRQHTREQSEWLRQVAAFSSAQTNMSYNTRSTSRNGRPQTGGEVEDNDNVDGESGDGQEDDDPVVTGVTTPEEMQRILAEQDKSMAEAERVKQQLMQQKGKQQALNDAENAKGQDGAAANTKTPPQPPTPPVTTTPPSATQANATTASSANTTTAASTTAPNTNANPTTGQDTITTTAGQDTKATLPPASAAD